VPDTQSQIINLVTSAQADVMRQENVLAHDVVRAYENARRDLLSRFSDQFHALGSTPSPEDIRRLANDVTLIRAIEERIAQLDNELVELVRRGLTDVSSAAYLQAGQEILLLAESLGVAFLPFAVDPLLELTIGPALEQIPALAASLRASITGTLREMLASGDRFSSIINAVYAQNGSAFARGRTSAELMVRRAVIQANNNSRMLWYESAKKQIPGLQKQVVSAISTDTTDTCLRAHGQIQELDQPFHISGTPSFGEWQMAPPFHWSCRSTVAPYHPIFERTSSLTTPAMEAAAQAELNSR
jgi:hypothetical protein